MNAKRLENWVQYCAGKYALGVAKEYALSWDIESIQRRVYDLAGTFRSELSNVPGVQVVDEGAEKVWNSYIY